MLEVTESVLISRSLKDVFSFACDYRNDVRWRSGVVKMNLEPEGVPILGTRSREEMRFMGRLLITHAEVVRLEPGHEIAFRVTDGPVPAHGYRRLVPYPGGTEFTYHIEAETQGFDRLLAPLMQWSFRRNLVQDLQRLKRLMENGVGENE
jgi:uncharacterized membrane protein